LSDGRLLLIDTLPEARSTLLYVVDPATGQVRAMYPMSAAEFVTGPALLVPEPAEQALTFDMRGDQIVAVTRRTGVGEAERAVRVSIRQEDVRFRNGDVTLAGTLLTPLSGSRFPAVVLTHGGGATLREWYWGFGYQMAARGFAVLAFDKRGVGESSGDWRTATFEELADDAVSGARYLQSRPEVDRQRIGFWGLSQGAWIGPLAAVRFGSAAFVLTMSGGGLTPAQGELLDSEYAMRIAGFSDVDVREGVAFQQARDGFMRGALSWNEYAARLRTATTQRWWRLAGTDLSGPATADDAYWANTRRFYFYDPAPTLRALRAPLLALFGELDSPEGVTSNVAAMRAALEAGKHPDFVIRVFPNGRHNLMDLAGFAPGEYSRLQRFVPGLFDTMASWLERHARP
jgi:pimeloyl-ACP methyl ester carboxylesterase